MLFTGGGGFSSNPSIRRSIRLECENATSMNATGSGYSNLCEFVDCSNGICEHDPIKFMKPMLQEISAKKQYTWHLLEEEYDGFSVFISKEDVVGKGVRILDVLMSIPRAEVRRKREKGEDSDF
ncbi:hypothetical protein ACS0TY_008091 [Phlomoides rotata]